MNAEVALEGGGSPFALIACGIAANDQNVVTAAVAGLNLTLHWISKNCVSFSDLIASTACSILIDANDWSDDEIAELASRLVTTPHLHGGILVVGQARGPATRHLVTGGLLRRVSLPLARGELTAALVASLQRRGKASVQSFVHDARVTPAIRVLRGGAGEYAQLRDLLSLVVARRRARSGIFPEGLFADPAWDILLSLAQARIEGRATQASNIGIEAGIPPSTALRRVKDLEQTGLVNRWGDPNDRRRDFVQLSEQGMRAFMQYAQKIAEHESGHLGTSINLGF